MPAMNLATHRLSNALEQRGIHFGWVMVALAFVNALFATSAVGVPSVLIVPMAEDLGWSIGELAAQQACAWLYLGCLRLSQGV